MMYASEMRNDWLNVELQSPPVIERRSRVMLHGTTSQRRCDTGAWTIFCADFALVHQYAL